jgi:SAM-dependent methyltransferase
MPARSDLHEANRRSWNAATAAHNSHKEGQAAFLRSGGTTLFPEEIALLGQVRGGSVLHLMCNAGPDTLSIAGLGARVTGVDISDEAIRYAKHLSLESGIAADFLRSDVYDFLATALERTWDVVYLSYGAYIWLSDLDTFLRQVARVLAPGGRLIVMEFHPLLQMFDESWNLVDEYSTAGRPVSSNPGVHDYVGFSGNGLVPWGPSPGVQDFTNPHECHQFNWSLGDILAGVIGAGLRMEHFREYLYSNGCKLFVDMVQVEGRRFVPSPGHPVIPQMFSIVARRDKP